MSRVFVPLAERPFRKFERGSKNVEIRSQRSPADLDPEPSAFFDPAEPVLAFACIESFTVPGGKA